MKSGEQHLRSEVTDILGQYDLFSILTVSGMVKLSPDMNVGIGKIIDSRI